MDLYLFADLYNTTGPKPWTFLRDDLAKHARDKKSYI